MDRTIDVVTRYGKLFLCLAVAVTAIWRCNTYVDPRGPSLLPAIMCTAFAMAVTFMGFALAAKDAD